MSEDIQLTPQSLATKPKQYLLMADEYSVALLGKVVPGLLFVEVEGLGMESNKDYAFLVNPIVKPAAAPDSSPEIV